MTRREKRQRRARHWLLEHGGMGLGILLTTAASSSALALSCGSRTLPRGSPAAPVDGLGGSVGSEGGAPSDAACAPGDCTADPPSCRELPSDCGLSGDESCCASLAVEGGTYQRSNIAEFSATVSTFRLDKYEVTVGRFRTFVDAVASGWRPATGSGKHAHLHGGKGLRDSAAAGYEQGWDSAWNDRLPSTATAWNGADALQCDARFATWTPDRAANELLPINCVNLFQAAAFCIWDEGFLPSEAEWNYAATGGNLQREYPWGNDEPDPDSKLAIYDCNFMARGSCSGVANIAPVGSVPAGAGRFGQLDLAGSVWEWTQDRYSVPYDTECIDCARLSDPSSLARSFRGGSFADVGPYLHTWVRYRGAPAVRDRVVGLRCARSP